MSIVIKVVPHTHPTDYYWKTIRGLIEIRLPHPKVKACQPREISYPTHFMATCEQRQTHGLKLETPMSYAAGGGGHDIRDTYSCGIHKS